MNKRARWITYDIILCILTIAISVWHLVKVSNGHWFYYSREIEYGTYTLIALCFVRGFARIVKIINTNPLRIVFGLGTSCVYTIVVFIYNNLLRCISLNSEYRFLLDGETISYIEVLKWDISYSVGWGPYRYPLIFLLMAVLCASAMLYDINREKVTAFFKKITSGLWNLVIHPNEFELERTDETYKLTELSKYKLKSMWLESQNQDLKEELLRAYVVLEKNNIDYVPFDSDDKQQNDEENI